MSIDTASNAEKKDRYIRALLAERDYCKTMGKDERLSAIDEELKSEGYDARKARKDQLETADANVVTENTDAPKVGK